MEKGDFKDSSFIAKKMDIHYNRKEKSGWETHKIIIELSLGITLKNIRWKEGQKAVHNLPGKRGIRMDFCVEDGEGKFFDVEMQKHNGGNISKRTRFYQALIDAPLLESGEKGFDGLRPLYLL